MLPVPAGHPVDHAQGRRLSGSVGAEQTEIHAARHLEIDRVHRGAPAEKRFVTPRSEITFCAFAMGAV
jgi:hypothetical protein